MLSCEDGAGCMMQTYIAYLTAAGVMVKGRLVHPLLRHVNHGTHVLLSMSMW